jgi:DNA invertase Pin-like site-specific DNA recombinase
LLHLSAALAEKERTLISARKTAALAAKKAQGVRPGDPTSFPEVRTCGRAAQAEAADAFAARVLPIVRGLQAAGVTTARAIAAALNLSGARTARRGMASKYSCEPSGAKVTGDHEPRTVWYCLSPWTRP